MGLNGRVGTGAEAGRQLVLVWGGVRGLLQLRPGLELGELLVLGLTKRLGSPCAEGELEFELELGLELVVVVVVGLVVMMMRLGLELELVWWWWLVQVVGLELVLWWWLLLLLVAA